MIIYDVKINGISNPMGMLFDTVGCSWKVKESKGRKQIFAKIEVSLEEQFQNIIYEKHGEELNSLGEQLEFELQPYTRYYYRIIVEDDLRDKGTSEIAYFETAKMKEIWSGHWIGMNKVDLFHPEFEKMFTVHGEIERARLYICGLGLFEAEINGQKVGNDLLAPFINDYKQEFQYCTYDISNMLKHQNRIQVCLGNGWYKGRFGFSGQKGCFGQEFLLRAELRIQYKNGKIDVLGTDESWRYRESIYEITDIYDGEKQNYLLSIEKENLWRKAQIKEDNIPLTERYSPPLHEMETLPVMQVLHTPIGETVLDFGQNFAGYVECKQVIPKGKTMTLEFGEVLQDDNFYHDNYRSAKSRFDYISDGKERTIRAHFTFFGFRYVKVTGLKEIQSELFEGKVIYSEMKRTGMIETSNRKINRLYENSIWGMKSNFLDIPTDCPQRDERLGWTGDAQVFSWTAAFHMDTRAFYQKFLKDLRSDQTRNDGKVAIYFPNTFEGITASVWGDIATFLPSMLYQYYGDKTALETNYPLMKDWVDYIYREDKKQGTHNLYDFGYQFGDWLALDGATEQSNYGRTENAYIASAYYYASALKVAEAAKILGIKKDERKYRELSENIYAAILAEYFSPNGRLTIDTQTGYLVALKFGIYRDKQKLIEGLKKRVKADCYRIKGGFVGATMMNTVLAEHGMSDLAYDFLFFEGFPGWLYSINLGATTIWERWNSILPNGKISGTSMNSLNHYAYGSVIEFLYRYGAGIQPETPGFKSIILAPMPDARFTYLNCSYESASGTYVSNWKVNEDGTLSFHFEIPFGAKAKVILPSSQKEAFELKTGKYDFTYQPERDYRFRFSETTRLELLLENDQAKDILFAELPLVKAMYHDNNIENMSKTLLDMKSEEAMLGWPTEKYDTIIEKIKKIQ